MDTQTRALNMALHEHELTILSITPEIAAHIVWFFDGTAPEPGSFTKNLIATISHADTSNQGKLAKGFPGHVAAVELAQNQVGGMDWLRAKVGA